MKRLALVVALALAATVPLWVSGTYYVNIASQILFYAIFALGINVLAGYAGLVTLGHAGLFGIAAYAGARIMNAGAGHLAVAAGALAVTLVAAAVFAALALRGTGLGFVMITVALGQIVWGVAYRWISITGGDNGISVRGRPSPLGLSLAAPTAFYWATLVVFLVAVVSMAIFAASPFGASVCGTRDQPRRMNALGYHVWVIAGGTATLLGPIAGAALVVIVRNVASAHIERWNFVLGAIFVVIVVFMPEGLVPGTARLGRWALAAVRPRAAPRLGAPGPEDA